MWQTKYKHCWCFWLWCQQIIFSLQHSTTVSLVFIVYLESSFPPVFDGHSFFFSVKFRKRWKRFGDEDTVLARYSGFFLQSRNMHISLNSLPKFPVEGWVCVAVCPQCWPVMDWWPDPVSMTTGNGHQLLLDPAWMNEWMKIDLNALLQKATSLLIHYLHYLIHLHQVNKAFFRLCWVFFHTFPVWDHAPGGERNYLFEGFFHIFTSDANHCEESCISLKKKKKDQISRN